MPETNPVRVLCWSDLSEPAEVYPDGINGAIANYLRTMSNLEVRVASINDHEQGISTAALDSTDVLIWWAHRKHKDIQDAGVTEAVRQIRERGLGFIALHSSHYSKIFKAVLNGTCDLGGWRDDGKPEFVKCVAPSHPIAQGIGDFVIAQSEMYNEPFKVPEPEMTVFRSTWESGEQFRACNTWTIGRGRVVHFAPGHETYPIYFQELPLKVIANCVLWCARRT